MPLAAKMGDMHACPMSTPGTPPIPHVGGPVMAGCCPTVMINNTPAAVTGAMCICVGPPDAVVGGSSSVFFGGMPAARQGDMTAHGGTIVAGSPNVMIGG